MSYAHELRVVMEDDGSAIGNDVLDTMFQLNEKLGTVMLLKEGEESKSGTLCLLLNFKYTYGIQAIVFKASFIDQNKLTYVMKYMPGQ